MAKKQTPGLFRRDKRKSSHCPRCGVYVCPGYQNTSRVRPPDEEVVTHECDPEFLKRSERVQNAVMKRDPDEEAPRRRSESQRLAEGFAMLEGGYDEGDDE